ncbi:hypothetical protein EC844_10881 [Acinetobacter calcoaceticus]|uniref:UPF0125 protein EC844_10881 n=1 Tax=Acinetobacter calcoaceticus TaxID=471 RepID=A0A4R1XT26_ACICA|nr:hypothetical protein EC844_10881 [Acinetobacter calcoaceticus]
MLSTAKIWVAYASPDQQYYLELDFVVGMTLQQAIKLSGIADLVELPEQPKYGIYGLMIKDMNHLLHAGDRVEIYRPLLIHPQDIRRKRAVANPVGRYCRGNRFK